VITPSDFYCFCAFFLFPQMVEGNPGFTTKLNGISSIHLAVLAAVGAPGLCRFFTHGLPERVE
jgi:hypothetical protein